MRGGALYRAYIRSMWVRSWGYSLRSLDLVGLIECIHALRQILAYTASEHSGAMLQSSLLLRTFASP